MSHWRVTWIGVAVSAVALVFFYTQIDMPDLLRALQTANYGYVIPCVALLLVGLVTRGMRWRILLNGQLRLERAFHIMNIAYLVNGILPFRIGEFARMYLASRGETPVPVMQSASTIITERLLDLLAVVVMALIALSAAPLPPELQNTLMLMGPAALVGFLTLVLLARHERWTLRQTQRLVERFGLFGRLNLQMWVGHFMNGLRPLTEWRKLLGALGFTALSWGISAWAGYVLMFAFYPQASWFTTFLYIAAAAFAIAVPAIPGNIGTYEAAILIALEATGYSAYTNGQISSVAFSFAIMVHAVNLAVHIGTGILGFVQEGITLEQLSHGVRTLKHIEQDATN